MTRVVRAAAPAKALIVEVEIAIDHIDEFLKVIEEDGSIIIIIIIIIITIIIIIMTKL